MYKYVNIYTYPKACQLQLMETPGIELAPLESDAELNRCRYRLGYWPDGIYKYIERILSFSLADICICAYIYICLGMYMTMTSSLM